MAVKKPVLAFGGVPTVNLLPRPEVERRERLALSRVWASAALITVIVTALVVVGAFALKLIADQQLMAAQARTNDLILERAQYSDVSETLAATGSLEAFRSEAMARDFAWTPLVEDVLSRLPEGVAIIEVVLAPRPDPVLAAGIPADTVGASGTMSFTAADARAQSETVRALRDLPGIISVDAGSLFAAGEDAVEFSVALVYDTTIYSGDFALEGEG